jgi:multiple sugar transport system substrate-binding protein
MLGWTGTPAENAQLQTAIADFERLHPTWRVAGRLTPDYPAVLSTALSSATPPDLFLAYSHQLGDLVADGRLLALPATYPVEIAPNLAAAIQVDGQNYCVPHDVSVLALFYNPAIFAEGEVPPPTSAWGWTDLRAAAEATSDAVNGLYGLALAFDTSRLYPFLLQADNDGDVWRGLDATTAVETVMDLYNDSLAAEPATFNATWNGEAFGLGRAAMTIEGNWLVDYLAAEFPDLEYGIAELPAGPVGRGTVAFVTCWVVNRDAADPNAALQLAAYLGTPEVVAAWADASHNLPPTLDQATAWLASNSTYAPFVAGLAYADPWTGPEGFIREIEAVNTAMRMWYNDEATTPELVARLGQVDGGASATPTPAP